MYFIQNLEIACTSTSTAQRITVSYTNIYSFHRIKNFIAYSHQHSSIDNCFYSLIILSFLLLFDCLLYCVHIHFTGIDETCNIINSMGGFCKGYIVDISKKEDVYKAAEEIKTDIGDVCRIIKQSRHILVLFLKNLMNFLFVIFKQVTLLFNNAGVVSGHLLLDTPDHLIERSFNVNIISHFWVSGEILLIQRNKKGENSFISQIEIFLNNLEFLFLKSLQVSKISFLAILDFFEPLKIENFKITLNRVL